MFSRSVGGWGLSNVEKQPETTATAGALLPLVAPGIRRSFSCRWLCHLAKLLGGLAMLRPRTKGWLVIIIIDREF